MSKDEKTALRAIDIPPKMAMRHAIGLNMLCLVVADMPDLAERLKRAKKQLLDDQDTATFTVKSEFDYAEHCVLQTVKKINKRNKNYH